MLRNITKNIQVITADPTRQPVLMDLEEYARVLEQCDESPMGTITWTGYVADAQTASMVLVYILTYWLVDQCSYPGSRINQTP
jgi:hypothetical protein